MLKRGELRGIGNVGGRGGGSHDKGCKKFC